MNTEWKICTVFISLTFVSSQQPPPFSEEMIKLVNASKTTWIAGRNFPENTNYSVAKTLTGTIIPDHYYTIMASDNATYNPKNIPSKFDAREHWKKCPSLLEIRNQGLCSSCWAVSPAAAMTDRFCIQSNAKHHFIFASADIHTCCISQGCRHGGYSSLAWQYWNLFGVVSGGGYNSSFGCKPYAIPPCEYFICNSTSIVPICVHKCEQSYRRPYRKDKRFGLRVYSIKGGENQIKGEIMNRGPVTATFQVYTDFLSYKRGVYQHKYGEFMGGHTVKLIGWGVKKGTPYWLAANSWGQLWGKRGFFKILRSVDHCGIESVILGGEPSYEKHVTRSQLDLDISFIII